MFSKAQDLIRLARLPDLPMRGMMEQCNGVAQTKRGLVFTFLPAVGVARRARHSETTCSCSRKGYVF